mgnify:CR=1 FL=1
MDQQRLQNTAALSKFQNEVSALFIQMHAQDMIKHIQTQAQCHDQTHPDTSTIS